MSKITGLIFYIFLILIFPFNFVSAQNEVSDKDRKLLVAICNKTKLLVEQKIFNDQDKLSKRELADLKLELSELIYYKLVILPTEEDKKDYKKVLEETQNLYQETNYSPGLYQAKSKLYKFEVSGIEEKLTLENYKKIEEDILNKYDRYKNEKIEQKPEDTVTSLPSQSPVTVLTPPSDSSPVLASDSTPVPARTLSPALTPIEKEIPAPVKEENENYKRLNVKLGIADVIPAMKYKKSYKISPVLKHLELKEPLKKQLEVEEKKGLLNIQKEWGKTKLTISGQKTLSITYSNIKYSGTQQASSSSWGLDQTLNVQVRGQIGDNVEVNVDYNDNRSAADRQKLSIEYAPKDPIVLDKVRNENILQRYIAFGDVQLSLPGTEYVTFGKSVFGLKGGIEIQKLNYSIFKMDRLSLDLIASRTKGQRGHQEYRGQSATSEISNLYDINYSRHRYYQITTGVGIDTYPLTPSYIYPVTVYIDDYNPGNDKDLFAEDTTGWIVNPKDPAKAIRSDTYSLHKLTPGRDYDIDYNNGLLTFKSYINSDYTIAVSYRTDSGYFIEKKIIRIDKETENSDTFSIYELKNRYVLGVSQLDPNAPDFTFEIRDEDGNSQIDFNNDGVYDSTFLQVFGLDKTGPGPDGKLGTSDDRPDGRIDEDYIDYNEGIIKFDTRTPFADSSILQINPALNSYLNPKIYTNPDLNTNRRYQIYIKTRAIKQQYTLNAFDIIRNSETVRVDGRLLSRNIDYYIDYESGFLFFLDSSLISDNSLIEIDYENVPFLSANKTILGGRIESDINKNLKLGATVILNSQDKPREIPDIGGSPVNNIVRDFNTAFRPVNLIFDFLRKTIAKNLEDPSEKIMDIKIITEHAESTFMPNTYGKAMVDDMESAKDEVNAPISENSWLVTHIEGLPTQTKGYIGTHETYDNENIGHKQDLETNETVRSLEIGYYFEPGDSWVAMRTIISKQGIDISDKDILDLWVSGIDEGISLNIDIGIVTEDADGDGKLDQEDAKYEDGVREDKEDYPDNILNSGEDVGIKYNTGSDTHRPGAGNEILDSEDMDGNLKIDKVERYFSYTNINKSDNPYVTADTRVIQRNGMLWTNYKFNIHDLPNDYFDSASHNTTNKADFTFVKHIRLWFTRNDTSSEYSDSIYIDRLAVIGTRWVDKDLLDTNFYVAARNYEDDGYPVFQTELDMREINKDEVEHPNEQSFLLTYKNLDRSDYGSDTYYFKAEKKLGRKITLERYSDMKLYLKNDVDTITAPGGEGGETLFFRFGNVTSYFEYRTEVPKYNQGWQLVDIDLREYQKKINELVQKDIPDSVSVFGSDSKYRIVIKKKIPAINNLPSLSEIQQMELGIIGDTVNPVSGAVLINTIHVDGIGSEVGKKQKIALQSNFFNSALTLNGSLVESKDRFRMVDVVDLAPSAPVENTSKSANSSIQVHKLFPAKWGLNIPFSTSWSENVSKTKSSLVKTVSPGSIGKTTTENESYKLTITKTKFPNISSSLSKSETDKDYRNDSAVLYTESFNNNVSYSYNFPKKLFSGIPLIKKIGFLKNISSGKNLSLNTNYQYNYNITRNTYFNKNTEDIDNKLSKYYKKLSITYAPSNIFRFKPYVEITDNYKKTRYLSGKEKNQFNSGINIDVSQFVGVKPNFDFIYNMTKDYDISDSRGIPVKSLSGKSTIRIDVFPKEWWKAIRFTDYKLTYTTNYSENVNARKYPLEKSASIDGAFSVDVNIRPKEVWEKIKYFTVHYAYSNNVKVSYSQIDQDAGFTDIFNNYFSDYIWPWSSKKRIIKDNELSKDRSGASNSQKHTYNGQFYFWDPLNIRYNVSKDASLTGNYSENYSNALAASLYNKLDIMKGFHILKNVNKTYVNFDYSFNLSENGNYDNNTSRESTKHTRTFVWHVTWNDTVNTTLNISFPLTVDKSFSSSEKSVVTTDQLNASISFGYKFKSPFKIKKPMTTKGWLFHNVLNVNGTLSYNTNTAKDNRKPKPNSDTSRIDFSTTATYDLSNFIRMNGGIRYSNFTDKVQEASDRQEISANMTVTITF